MSSGGERGAGKTRLVEECLTTDLLSGIRVFRCRAPKPGGRTFLGSVLDALASADITAGLHDLAEPWRATMLELLAEPQAGTTPSYGPPAVESDPVRRRDLEAIGQLLVLMAGNNPSSSSSTIPPG